MGNHLAVRPPGSAVGSTAITRTVPVRLRKGISMCRAQFLIVETRSPSVSPLAVLDCCSPLQLFNRSPSSAQERMRFAS